MIVIFVDLNREKYKGLVPNYQEGGYKMGVGGGGVKFYPYEKGGGVFKPC